MLIVKFWVECSIKVYRHVVESLWNMAERLKTCLCAFLGLWHRKGEWEDAERFGYKYLLPSWPADGVAVIAVLGDSLASFPGGFSGTGLHIYTQVLSACFITLKYNWSPEEGDKADCLYCHTGMKKEKAWAQRGFLTILINIW